MRNTGEVIDVKLVEEEILRLNGTWNVDVDRKAGSMMDCLFKLVGV